MHQKTRNEQPAYSTKRCARYQKLMHDPYPSKAEESYCPTFLDGFLYFFGLVDNPHNQAIEVFRQRNRRNNLKRLIEYSDGEAMQIDQKALHSDWEQVGKYLHFAVKKLQEQHPELEERIPRNE